MFIEIAIVFPYYYKVDKDYVNVNKALVLVQ